MYINYYTNTNKQCSKKISSTKAYTYLAKYNKDANTIKIMFKISGKITSLDQSQEKIFLLFPMLQIMTKYIRSKNTIFSYIVLLVTPSQGNIELLVID